MTERRPRIVVMEDNPADVMLLREALQEAGLDADLIVIRDGAAAIEWIGAAPRTPRSGEIDLVLIDLNLPRYHGTEILEHFKKEQALREVPVAVMSSSDSPQDRVEASTLGAECYLLKPCTLDEFLKLGRQVKELIDGRTRVPR